MTLDTLKESFSHTLQSFLGENRTDRLGYIKLYARCLPIMLTPEYRQNRVYAVREFLEHYEMEGKTFLDLILTEDET